MQEILNQIATLESKRNGILLHDLDIAEEVKELKEKLLSFTPAFTYPIITEIYVPSHD